MQNNFFNRSTFRSMANGRGQTARANLFTNGQILMILSTLEFTSCFLPFSSMKLKNLQKTRKIGVWGNSCSSSSFCTTNLILMLRETEFD